MKKALLVLALSLVPLSVSAKPWQGGGVCQCVRAPCDCAMPSTPPAPIKEGQNGIFSPEGCKKHGGTPQFPDKPGGCMMDAGVVWSIPTK